MSDNQSEPESNYRYLAYLVRFKRIIRYLAYTSDVGEAFRPLTHPRVVQSAYAISWLYVIGDVFYEGYHEKNRGSSNDIVARTVTSRAIYQAVASMLLPAIAIHTQVVVFKNIFDKVGRYQRWGPTIAGLLLIPLLPYIIDHPVEVGVESLYHHYWPVISTKKHID